MLSARVLIDRSLCALVLVVGFGTSIFSVSPACAADRKIATAEQYKMESNALFIAAALLEKGVWKEGDNEFKLFNKFGPKDTVKVAEYDVDKKDFVDSYIEIPGSQYRLALAGTKAFASYSKLDDEGKTRVNMMYFGQADRPTKGSKEYKIGAQKIKEDINIISGEQLTRPATPVPK